MKSKHRGLRVAKKYILIYLSGLMIGSLLFWYYPAYEQAKIMRTKARSIAQSYTENGKESLAGYIGGTMRIVVYDKEKTCVYYAIPGEEKIPYSLDETDRKSLARISRYLDTVLKGKDLCRITLNWNMEQEYWGGALVLIGLPVWEDETIIGAVFVLRNYFTIFLSFSVFLLSYTVISILLCALSVSRINRKRRREEMEDLKRNYVDNVTHTLKTPVCAIRAMAEALCDEVVPGPEKQKLYCGRILLEAKKQERMIQDILKLSEIQNHQMDFSKSAVSAAQCFSAVMERYQELCECMDISFHQSDQLMQLPLLNTNLACIYEVMGALLDNAIKFTRENGDIWVEVAVSNDQATICVRDNGNGIRKEEQPHIFERFYKGSGKRNENGSGLGLAIVREIVEGLQEKIWIESEEGNGTAFYFTVHFK